MIPDKATTSKMPVNCETFVSAYDRTGDGVRAALESALPVFKAGDVPVGYYVYGLLSSIGDVFYVGKGSKRRWLWHYQRPSGTGNHRKLKRIADVGSTPACVVFAQGLAEQDAFELESALIKRLPDLTNLASGQRSERERNKYFAQLSLEDLPSMEDWLRSAPRTPEDIEVVRRLRAELQAMAIHGWEDRYDFVTVNRVVQTVNGLPYLAWKAQMDAYQADVARFLQ